LTDRGRGVHRAFPPDVMVEVKALACELPHELGLPLSRLSVEDLRREVVRRGIVASIGKATIWRWLSDFKVSGRTSWWCTHLFTQVG